MHEGEGLPDHILLMRAIGPGNTMPMAELRAMCSALGYTAPETYIASGNLILGAEEKDSRQVAAALEAAIAKRFGLDIHIVGRLAANWRGYVQANPFAGDEAATPKMLHLGLAKDPPPPGLIAALEERAMHGERIRIAGDALWIDYGEIGAGQTKLTPAYINKHFGAPVTQRNLNTVNKLLAMVEARA